MVGDGALLASLARATGRGMRDIVATIQREQDEAIRSPAAGVTIVPAARAPARPRSPCTARRTCSTPTATGSPAAASSWSARPPCSSTYIARGAAVAGRGHGDAALARLAGRRATTRPGSTRRTVAAIKGSLRMRRVLERAARGRGARRARPSCGCCTAARCCGWTAPTLDRIRRHGAAPRRAPQRGPRRRLRRRSSTRCGRRPASSTVRTCRRSARLRGGARRPRRLPGLPAGLVAAAAPRCRCCGWLADPSTGCARTPTGCCPREEIDALASVLRPRCAERRADDRRRGAAGRAGRAAGPPPQQPRHEEPQPVPRAATGCRRSPRSPTGRRPPGRGRGSAPTTTATTRTSWSTRRRTCRRCSGG